jgi:hypothetical protein
MELPPPSLLFGNPMGFSDDRIVDEITNKMRDRMREKAQSVEDDFRKRLVPRSRGNGAP